MFLIYFIWISALTADVKCDCDHYIDCFGEFLQDFFGYNNGTDDKFDRVGNSSKYTEVDDTGEEIEKVLSDVSDLIKEISGGVEKTFDVKESENVKIFVKTFDFDHSYEDIVQTTQVNDIESTTENEDFTITSTEYVTTLPLISSVAVIPLKSDTENEISKDKVYYKDIPDIYDDLEERLDDNTTDYPIIDYIELYKDTTNEYIEYKGTEPPTVTENSILSDEIKGQEKDIENVIDDSLSFLHDDSLNNLIKNVSEHTVKTCNGDKSTLSDAVFPWIAAIFVKNDSKGFQYEYYCDGALLSKKFVITSARCVLNGNSTFDAEDYIVILGKKSLQASGESEKILKVDSVTVHSNFSAGDVKAMNDLAMLKLENDAGFGDAVSSACSITDEAHFDGNADAITTAWSLSGDLTLIFFDKERSKACGSDNKVENTFCATYGNEVALCPSYGGLYVAKASDDRWYLRGLRHGNPQERGICFLKDVEYTALGEYSKWTENIINKD